MILFIKPFVRFWAKVDTSAGPTKCWRWRGVHNPAKGRRRHHWRANTCRPRVRIKATGPRTHMYVAPLMLLLHDPSMAKAVKFLGLEACHRPGVCDHDWCINPLHLYWGTKEENRRDRYGRR